MDEIRNTETLAEKPVATERSQTQQVAYERELAKIKAERAAGRDPQPAEQSDDERRKAAALAPLADLRLAGGNHHLIAGAIEQVIHALFSPTPPKPIAKSDEQLAEERAASIDPKTGLLLSAGTEHPDVSRPPISDVVVTAHQVMPMAEARQTGPAVVVGVEGHIKDESLSVDKNISGEQPSPEKATGNTVAGTPGPVPTQAAQPEPLNSEERVPPGGPVEYTDADVRAARTVGREVQPPPLHGGGTPPLSRGPDAPQPTPPAARDLVSTEVAYPFNGTTPRV